MTQAVATLYEKLGGSAAVETVVRAFYDKVMADDELRGFFANTNMDFQTQQQVKFLSMALGGPNEYKGASMADAHKDLAITEHHFGLVAAHLVSSLRDAGAGQEEIDAVVSLVGLLQAEIVTA